MLSETKDGKNYYCKKGEVTQVRMDGLDGKKIFYVVSLFVHASSGLVSASLILAVCLRSYRLFQCLQSSLNPSAETQKLLLSQADQ